MADKYSNWLLVSDIDGTLNNKLTHLPKNNKLAIERFVGNGGVFTLCSGRNLESLTKHYKRLSVETPAIFLNGAGIYDFSSKKIIDFNPIPDEGEKAVLDIFARFPKSQLTVFGAETVYLATKKCLYGYILSKMDDLNYKVCENVSDLPHGVWGKVTFFGNKNLVKTIENVVQNEYGSLFDCFFTSPFTLELVKKGINKGFAVRKLSEILGIDLQKTAAIGDYYNDVDMLKAVTHPACCGQAPQDIKQLAEYVTCHCNKGAVADFINHLEKNYIL